jgi:hypothetical protein
MYKVKQTDSDINDQLNLGAAWEDDGDSATPGKSYEAGVLAGIRWVIGDTNDTPIEEGPEE